MTGYERLLRRMDDGFEPGAAGRDMATLMIVWQTPQEGCVLAKMDQEVSFHTNRIGFEPRDINTVGI